MTRRVQQAGKSVVIFTGYTKTELYKTENQFQRALLRQTDLLVAGPYKKDTPGRHPLLSSINQELIYQSSRYKYYGFGNGVKRMEYVIKRDGEISVSGFPLDVR
jgi:anaerobic ribonucleoside-triphosphate reductase activating protein